MENETKLFISDADKPLAFLELSDDALAKFCRKYLIMVEEKVGISAGNKQMPFNVCMAMHGSIALYRLAVEANAENLTFDHSGVEWNGVDYGDWTLTIKRNK